MLRSLYSGVSGMRSFQTKLDVIANNIANVNTTGFKSSRVRFQDMLSQTVSNARGATTGGLGGVNAQQIGLGVSVGSIDTVMTVGAMQPTNRELDFAIEGDGFFVVSPVADEDGNFDVGEFGLAVLNYTRDGAFYLDHEGNLVTSSGYRVLGYESEDEFEPIFDDIDSQEPELIALTIPPYYDDDEENELESFSIDSSGVILAKYRQEDQVRVIGKIAVAKFSNAEGLEFTGGNNYRVSNNSGDPIFGMSGEYGFGHLRQGYLEMSNVDLANEFTEMIVTSRAYSANSRSITTSDEMLQELLNLKR